MIVRRLARWRARADPFSLALVSVLVAACALRVYQLNWDEGNYLHPDERHIADVASSRISFDWPPDLGNLLDPARSHLNPRSDDPTTHRPREYAYGALPLIVTELVAGVLNEATGADWQAMYGGLHKVGRSLSALLDTATALVVYLIGRRVFTNVVGLVGAVLYALAPLSIQLAHFFTVDSWLTFFVSVTLLWSVRAAESGRLRWFAAAGVGFGLAMATKPSVIALGGVIGVAILADAFRRARRVDSLRFALALAPGQTAVASLAALAGFALFEPYALMRPQVYVDQLAVQARIIRGAIDVPYTRQYIGTTPVLYQVDQMVRWGLGPVAGLLCVAGVFILARQTVKRLNAGRVVLSSWLLGQGIVVLLPETKFLRYLAPLLPVLVLAGGLAFDTLLGSVIRCKGRRTAIGVAAAVLAGVAYWTASFSSVYAEPNPRLVASEWIYDHVPNGSALGAEDWDDALPVPLSPGLTPWDFQYQTIGFNIFPDRAPSKAADDLYHGLEQVDYVVLSSNRAMRAVRQSPWRYPVQGRYYDLLTGGLLGFKLVGDFHTDPGIGPIRISDQSADESFLNYDHPRVLIYHKESLIEKPVYDRLMAWAVARPFSPTRHADATSLMLDQPVGGLPAVDDARWSSAVTGNSLAALLVWLVLLAILQAAGLPLAWLALGRFADAGWGCARLLTLLVAGYLVWIGASLSLLSFRAIWAAVAVALVAASWLVKRRFGRDWRMRPEQRRTALAGEAVFWLVFAVFLLFRYLNPDSWHPIWGGEKPMEFAHLNAMLRSAHFPPYDPWFADGYINYYYYGLYLVAFCVKLTGIPSEIAFNLAQPTVIALLAGAGFTVAATLGQDIATRRRRAVPTGAIGALLLVGIGNLDAFVQVVRHLSSQVSPDFFGWTWHASRAISGGITEFPYFTGLYADLHAHVVALPITVLAIALTYALAKDRRPFAVSLSATPRRGAAARIVGARLVLLALVIGSLSATNAWDVPVYVALSAISLFMAGGLIRSMVARLVLSAVLTAAVGAIAYLLFLPFFHHYVALFGSLERVRSQAALGEFTNHLGGLLTIAGFGLVVALLGLKSSNRPVIDSPLAPLALIGSLTVARLAVEGRSGSLRSALDLVLIVAVATIFAAAAWPAVSSRRDGAGGDLIAQTVLGAALVAVLAAVAGDRIVLGLMLSFAGAGAVVWLRAASSAQRFAAAMIAAACLIVAGTELVFLADDLVTDPIWYRMNTIFKFYNQVWVLLALGAATLIALMLDGASVFWPAASARVQSAIGLLPQARTSAARPTTPDATTTQDVPAAGRWSRIGVAAAALVTVASLCYPMMATKPRLDQRFADHLGSGTLNALDWMHYGTLVTATGRTISFSDDLAAIDWFNEHVAGSPVIAEASIGPYRGDGSRFSIATGLPTIIGWDRHERQQRYPDGIEQRVQDVRQLYTSADPNAKMQIISRYNVQYIVVGDVERQTLLGDNPANPYASPTGIAAFQTMVSRGVLEVAFSQGATMVYHVKSPAR